MATPELVAETFLVRLRVRLRACTERDLPALEWNGEFEHHRELIRAAFERQKRGAVLMILAMSGERAVGQVWVDLERVASEGAGMLWAFRVVPWLSGRGVGRRLLAAAERFLARRGLRAAEIRAEVHNLRARRLYERLGYQVVGRVQEDYSYAPPGRPTETLHIDEWVLRKPVAMVGGADVRLPGDGSGVLP